MSTRMRVNNPAGFPSASLGEMAPARTFFVRRTADEASAVMPLIQWVFYLFIFSLPFETAELVPVEPPTVLGALLLLTTLFQPGLFLRWPPRGFWCFVVYLYLSVTLGALEYHSYPVELRGNLILLCQLLVLCWLAYCLLLDERVAKRALWSLAAACTLLALLQITGVVSRAADVGGKIERVTAFGFHPNNLARILMLGLLAAVGLAHGRRRRSGAGALYFIWPVIVLIGIALVQTGSRGGLLALGTGLMVFVLNGRTAWTRGRNLLGILLIMSFFIWAGFQSETTRLRFERTMEEGDLARREEIYPSAWQMFLEKPVTGWGAITSTFELGSRLGHKEEDSKNPHNLILYALISTGLLGAVPLFAGIALAAWAAWKARFGSQGVLPLAMVVAVLAANMSGVWLFNKLHWMVMAYALASGHKKMMSAAVMNETK